MAYTIDKDTCIGCGTCEGECPVGAISVSERTNYISRVRALARLCAAAYVEQREKLGFPMLKRG